MAVTWTTILIYNGGSHDRRNPSYMIAPVFRNSVTHVLHISSFPILVETLIGFLLVALCWGFTNPFIRRGSQGVDQIPAGPFGKQASELWYLFTRWQVFSLFIMI